MGKSIRDMRMDEEIARIKNNNPNQDELEKTIEEIIEYCNMDIPSGGVAVMTAMCMLFIKMADNSPPSFHEQNTGLYKMIRCVIDVLLDHPNQPLNKDGSCDIDSFTE